MEIQTVYLYVFDSLADWEPGYAIAGINTPQFQAHPGRYRIQTVALRESAITTMGGLRIEPDCTLDTLSPDKAAMLILPGGMTWETEENRDAIAVAGAFLNSGVPVAAICGATFAMAKGGLLDDRRHTSNAREYLAATQYKGVALYEDAPAVTDGNVITAPGFAPIDFAFHIFNCLELYTKPVVDAWYGLHKTGKAEYFYALMQAAKE
jgi:putative intracellular protease/amidase